MLYTSSRAAVEMGWVSPMDIPVNSDHLGLYIKGRKPLEAGQYLANPGLKRDSYLCRRPIPVGISTWNWQSCGPVCEHVLMFVAVLQPREILVYAPRENAVTLFNAKYLDRLLPRAEQATEAFRHAFQACIMAGDVEAALQLYDEVVA